MENEDPLECIHELIRIKPIIEASKAIGIESALYCRLHAKLCGGKCEDYEYREFVMHGNIKGIGALFLSKPNDTKVPDIVLNPSWEKKKEEKNV